MKKTLQKLSVVAMAIVAMTAFSCTKEQDLSGYMTKEEFQHWQNNQPSMPINTVVVKNFNVTIPAIDDDFTATATYNGLQGTLGTNDVLLIYFNTGLGGWTLLPFTYGTASYIYSYNTSVVTFNKSLTVRGTSGAEQFSARALIIPYTVYTANCNAGVDHTSYADVVNTYNLQAVDE